jgi:hypothetical protein
MDWPAASTLLGVLATVAVAILKLVPRRVKVDEDCVEAATAAVREAMGEVKGDSKALAIKQDYMAKAIEALTESTEKIWFELHRTRESVVRLEQKNDQQHQQNRQQRR